MRMWMNTNARVGEHQRGCGRAPMRGSMKCGKCRTLAWNTFERFLTFEYFLTFEHFLNDGLDPICGGGRHGEISRRFAAPLGARGGVDRGAWVFRSAAQAA